MREAAAWWAARGDDVTVRDAAWQHPDLVPDLEPATLAAALNRLLPGGDAARYQQLAENARRARPVLSWQHEEQELLQLYAGLLPGADLSRVAGA